MSDVEKVEQEVSILDDLFNERDSAPPEILQEEEAAKPVIKEKVKKETAEPEKEDDEPIEKKDPKEPIDKVEKKVEKEVDEDDKVFAEVEKLKKALTDSQKWGHTSNKRLKSAINMVNSLKDQGALTDDEFSKLSEFLHSDVEEEQKIAPESDDPLLRLVNIAAKRIDDLRTIYEDDPLFQKKAEAFDFFVNHCSEQEREDILDELKDSEDNDLKLAKKMLKIGEKYYEENYKELDSAGGLKELVSLKNIEIEKMKRKLDKLSRKLAEYEDYDKPNYKIDELGDTGNMVEGKPGTVIDEIFAERDRKKG